MESKFTRLKKSLNKKLVNGKGIKWLIEDNFGRSEYCINCGNIANGVLTINYNVHKYNLPYCNKHASKLENPPETAPFHVTIDRGRKSFSDWLKITNKYDNNN